MSNNNAPGVTIEEGNRLIAEFEDMVLHDGDSDYGEVYHHKDDKYKINRYPIHELKYHSSWDWLMPSWKKLGGLLYERRGQFDKEQYSKAHVYTQHILRAFQTVEIETAFYLIAETIRWYNTQTPQP